MLWHFVKQHNAMWLMQMDVPHKAERFRYVVSSPKNHFIKEFCLKYHFEILFKPLQMDRKFI